MKIEIKDRVIGPKPSTAVAEIISRLSLIDDAASLCLHLDSIDLSDEVDNVSVSLMYSKENADI
jgi:hypothetical protein